MGKGDKRTKKGKIFKGSFGKSRPHKPKKKTASSAPAPATAKSVAPAKSVTPKKKPAARKKKKEKGEAS